MIIHNKRSVPINIIHISTLKLNSIYRQYYNCNVFDFENVIYNMYNVPIYIYLLDDFLKHIKHYISLYFILVLRDI